MKINASILETIFIHVGTYLQCLMIASIDFWENDFNDRVTYFWMQTFSKSTEHDK